MTPRRLAAIRKAQAASAAKRRGSGKAGKKSAKLQKKRSKAASNAKMKSARRDHITKRSRKRAYVEGGLVGVANTHYRKKKAGNKKYSKKQQDAARKKHIATRSRKRAAIERGYSGGYIGAAAAVANTHAAKSRTAPKKRKPAKKR